MEARVDLSSNDVVLPAAAWRADLGDGTYRNPVLYADYSDPDAIRVGSDYWLTASSFSHVPGLPILHSRDLVHWKLVNHALPFLSPREHYATPRHGGGVWAPALRYHDGRYWIYYPDPDFGIYVVTARDPRDHWSEPHLVLAGQGLIDPCPLWDNGRCFLVHAWARSRSGRSNVITLQELTPNGHAPLGQPRDIVEGQTLHGWHTLEGPKLYKHNGWFWIFAPAGGVATGFQTAFRSRTIDGPYEGRIVLAQGDTSVNGPHQGAWVDTPEGEHWFLHFQELPAFGRVVHLQPMRWRVDTWPEMGGEIDHAGCGQPVPQHARPRLPLQAADVPATSDDFSSPKLGYQWQWQANPDDHWAQLDPGSQTLRLVCVPLARPDSHWNAAHLLLQKFPAPGFTTEVSLSFAARNDGECAGLMIFGYDYAWLGLRRKEGRLQAVLAICENAPAGASEQVSVLPQPTPAFDGRNFIGLRVEVSADALCQFAWSWDGVIYTPFGARFQARSSRWVGAKVGLFASATSACAEHGTASFQRFRVRADQGSVHP